MYTDTLNATGLWQLFVIIQNKMCEMYEVGVSVKMNGQQQSFQEPVFPVSSRMNDR